MTKDAGGMPAPKPRETPGRCPPADSLRSPGHCPLRCYQDLNSAGRYKLVEGAEPKSKGDSEQRAQRRVGFCPEELHDCSYPEFGFEGQIPSGHTPRRKKAVNSCRQGLSLRWAKSRVFARGL